MACSDNLHPAFVAADHSLGQCAIVNNKVGLVHFQGGCGGTCVSDACWRMKVHAWMHMAVQSQDHVWQLLSVVLFRIWQQLHACL